MLELKIKHSDGERELWLNAENMEELIAKIKAWQSWDQNLPSIQMTQRYKLDPDGELKRQRESGWYTFN